MTSSVHAWHDLLSGSSLDDIEEGLLEETNNTTQKFHDKSTAFPRQVEHGWKEVISDPSVSEAEISENSKTQGSHIQAGIGHKDWDHYLSAFSLNDEDSTKFMTLEEHADDTEFAAGNESHAIGMDGLETIKNTGEKKLIKTQGDLNKGVMEQLSSSKNIPLLLDDVSFSSKQNLAPPDGENLLDKSASFVRPGCEPKTEGNGMNTKPGANPWHSSDATFGFEKVRESTRRPNSVPLHTPVGSEWQTLIPLDTTLNAKTHWSPEPVIQPNSGPTRGRTEMHTPAEERKISTVDGSIIPRTVPSTSKSSKKNTLPLRPMSALDVQEVESVEQRSSIPRANSAPIWRDASGMEGSKSLGLSTLLPARSYTTRVDDWENQFEDRNISGEDENMVSGNVYSMSNTNSVEERRTVEGDLSSDSDSSQTSYAAIRVNADNGRPAITIENEFPDGDKNTPLEDTPLVSDDGQHSQKSDNLSYEPTATNSVNTEHSLNDKKEHPVVTNDDSKDEPGSHLLSDTNTKRPEHEESTNEATNIPSSRETAEILPVRPLTIGNSLNRGSTLAYRPITPFQPNLYPTETAVSVGGEPSTTSVSTASLSASHYSEGTLIDEGEREEDMSARERLQPLGRDGLEVKQGPPWGITMPLFQPESRDSSLSSNDSNASTIQFHQLQTTSNIQLQQETEPLQGASSTESDLPRKASIKSLESKEPMGVKMMNGAGNLKTPIGKFYQLNPDGVDSPVSKILGPTFKATQKMLEELQRRPLGAYDEDTERLPADTENARNVHETNASVEKETIVADQIPISRNYGGLASDTREESSSRSFQNERRLSSNENSSSKEVTTADVYHKASEDHRTSDLTPITTSNHPVVHGLRTEDLENLINSRPSSRGKEFKKAPRDNVLELSTNQRTQRVTSMTTTKVRVDNNGSLIADDLQGVPVSRPFSERKEFEASVPSSNSKGPIKQPTLDSTPITTENIVPLVGTARSPVVSIKNDVPERVGDNLEGGYSWRNDSHKQTSGMTDSTLGNTVGLSGHLLATELEIVNKGAELSNSEAESLKSYKLLEDRNEASEMSEFDRVASESISWSNAVVNQFREEMKSVDLVGEEVFLSLKSGEAIANEESATTPVLDSGLSESSTSDEIYRPKQLTRLSAGNGPVGIYDVRQSSGPGSTNRKRLALGKKPREDTKFLQIGDIYVSDGTTGTSGTDRENQRKHSRQRIQRAVYVSEGTTSGTERLDNDSGPEGQSTPKSEEINGRQSNALTTSDVSPIGNSIPLTDIYLGLANMKYEKPTSRSSFTRFEIEKPTRPSPSAFMTYNNPTKQNPSQFSTFEIDQPPRVTTLETSRNTLTASQKNGSVTRIKPAAKVDHTWSISKPVMSQLTTRASPLVVDDVFREPKVLTQQKQTSSEHRHKRASRQKKTVSKTSRQQTADAFESVESEKIPQRNTTNERTKYVADIILENMLQDEQEQKKRHKKLEVKQEQATQDLNQLWERFQDVFGKKSRSSGKARAKRVVHPRVSRVTTPIDTRVSRETTPTDISRASSLDALSSENRSNGRHSINISTDSDEEFEQFLRRIRELHSSESSYQEDNSSTLSRISSTRQPVMHTQSESETTPSGLPQRTPRHKVSNRSTSMTSTGSSEDRPKRDPIVQIPFYERHLHKGGRQTVNSSVVSSSVTEKKSGESVSLPMSFNVKNREFMKQEKSSSSCTCGAKSRKEKPRIPGVRDIGVNCPTPPLVSQDFLPVASDIAVLKTNASQEDFSCNPAPASLVKLTLQDAFKYSKQDFIEKSRERVMKLKEKCEERKNEKTSTAQLIVVVPSEKNKSKKENKKSNEDLAVVVKLKQLLRKKPRPMTSKEIRDVNKRMYKNLPEVRKKRDNERRAEFYKTNRLRAQLYGKHVRNTNRIYTAV